MCFLLVCWQGRGQRLRASLGSTSSGEGECSGFLRKRLEERSVFMNTKETHCPEFSYQGLTVTVPNTGPKRDFVALFYESDDDCNS